ncbi:MAG: winged helix-turn-helix domain-containing protein [Euryarchaeota archaeon]|nr:winged helix-turn-helix domain-containing protein [Euryarchaeota archaeon]MDE1836665.1 winged helix-turn-helix domain-containing protein [Euryarchaeota archaeon]MDE1880306.1 winged helix-turn-helix domain-containing protein [Euryarchaeota archaeon]MDE2044635.1 winged helix-turn-helix domain-containing protein [Thermoplasmata archaeon]
MAAVIRRILKALGEFDRAGAPAKLIAKRAGLPLRTVERHLKDLTQEGVIRQDYPRGPYIGQPGTPDIKGDPFGEEGIHGLTLYAKWRKGVVHTPLPRGGATELDDLVAERFPDMTYKPGVRWGVVKRLWRKWWVEIRHAPGKDSITVYVPSTERPIRFQEFGGLQGWLEGAFGIEDAGSKFMVTQIGIHTDYEGWRLKGLRAVELRRFSNALEQLYQKGKKVRHEVHLGPKDLTLAQAMQIVKEGSPTVRLEKLLQNELQLERHKAEVERTERPPPFPPPPGTDSYQSGYG